MLTFSLFTVVLFAYYNADLATYMTVKPNIPPLRSILDVAKSDYIPRTWPSMVLAKRLEMADPGSPFGKLHQKMRANWHYSDDFQTCYYTCMADLLKVRSLT